MFGKIINWFKKGGAKLGMVEELTSITDHPKIAINKEEYERIEENKRLYKAEFDDVEYINSDGEKKTRPFHSINIAKVVSRKLSKLIFNEGVEVSIEEEESNKFIQEVFEENKFRKNFGEQLEAGYAIGGLAIRPYVDSVSGKIKISYAQADSFFPLQSNTNDISEGAFVTRTAIAEGDKKVYYTLFEFHEWEDDKYIITNELYRSDKANKVGIKVSLKSLDKYADLQPVTVMKGFSRPLFVYIKLAGKNNNSLYSPLSLGIIDNSKQQFKDINKKYDEFMEEITNAQRKIIASDQFFKTRFDSNGRPMRAFDDKTSVFQRVRSDDPTLEDFAPNLRSSEYIESINFILRVIELQTGFSAGTFSFDGESVKTATEVVSENSETYATRQDNVFIVKDAIRELIVSIFELAEFYNLYNAPDNLHINIDFDDGVFESKESKLDYYGKADTYRFIPKLISMQKIWGISEKEAKEWLVMIQNEMNGMDPMLQENENYTEMYGDEE